MKNLYILRNKTKKSILWGGFGDEEPVLNDLLQYGNEPIVIDCQGIQSMDGLFIINTFGELFKQRSKENVKFVNTTDAILYYLNFHLKLLEE